MTEKQKVKIVNLITGSRILGTLLLPAVTILFGPLITAIYIGTLWSTDAIDGYLAKHKWKVSTIFGANLDAFSDKFLGIAILIYLSTFYPLMLLPLASEIAIFGVNWHYGKKGADVKSSYLGKIKTAILGGVTAFSILSTISLTSGLSLLVPHLINFITVFEIATVLDYVNTNKTYLKKHNPKKNVSNLNLKESIKEIIRLLKEEKIYSPKYYKEHKNETLIDMLYNENVESKESSQNEHDEKQTEKTYTDNEKEITIKYNITKDKLETIKKYMKEHNIDQEQMEKYLELYIKSKKNDEIKDKEIYDFIDNQIKTKKKS